MQANPVIVKELRGRMRGWRAAIVLTLYLSVLGIITLLLFAMLRFSGDTGGPQIGKSMFIAMVIFQLLMVGLLTPAFTAGSITSEREQKTYDLLMTTLLSARSVVFGKLGSALAYVALLILAMAPLESLTFMLGGVSPEEIILSQVVMLAAAVLFASIGIFWSTVVRSSVGSNVLSYGTLLFQMVGIPLLYFFAATIAGGFYGSGPGKPSLSEFAWFWYVSGAVLSLNPLAAMSISEGLLLQGDPLFIYTNPTMLNGKPLLVVSPWLVFCIEALLISAVLIALSVRNVKPVRYHTQAALPLTPQQPDSANPSVQEFPQG